MTAVNRPKPPCAVDPDLWFSDDLAEQEQAKTACGFCPIAATCLAGAVDRGEEFGIWGGEYLGPTFEMAGPDEPAAWLRPMVFAARHGENATYIGGCRCRPCTDSHAEYVAVWRWERKWIAPTEPELRPEQLPLFENLADTVIGRIPA